VLNLGVLDQPYASGNAVTTGEVAKILEEEYGIMRAFARVHSKMIETVVVVSVQNAIEALVAGHRVDPWGAGTQKIAQAFRTFINSGEAEHAGIPGTPTQAALRGVNHRRKRPYGRGRPHHPQPNPRRPSFRDTGLYVASFRSWVT
jgi:hypothetical protein